MKRRVMFAGVAAIAGLIVPLAAATPPADAGTGVGCTGTECSASVWQFVLLTPKRYVGAPGNSVIAINVPPPPCLWNPIGDATTGSQSIISQFGTVTQQDSLFDVYQSVQQAKKLLANPTPGTWYELPVNPAAGAAGAAECAKLPLFAFEAPGVAPPMPNVPPVDLAEYAYNRMKIPGPGLTVTPDRAWVNLASYAHLTTPGPITIHAQLGAVRVWVTATPSSPTLSSSSAGIPYYKGCGLDGSKYTSSQPGAGAGTAPDCGVLWRAPTTDGSITATVTWKITWGPNGDTTLPDVTTTDTVGGLRVAEIQSINGNGPGNGGN